MRRIAHRLIAVLTLVIFVLVQKPLPSQAAPASNAWYGCTLHLDRATATRVIRRQCFTHAMPREHRTRTGWTITRTRTSPHVIKSVRWPIFAPPPPPPLVGFPPLVARWSPFIYSAAQATGLPARVIAAVIYVESSGIPTVSSLGYDIGLMQFGPVEASIVGGSYTYDPAGNIMTGSKYLEYLRERYAGGNTYTAVAMYNGGSGNPQYGYAAKVFSHV